MQWEQWRNNSDALVAGPIPAGEYTTLPVALQPSDVALQGSFTIYLGANRGCCWRIRRLSVLRLVSSSLIRETTENVSANLGYNGRLLFQYASFNNSRSLHF